MDSRLMLVGHFYADGRFSGDRRLDPDVHGRETEFDIIRQIDDPRDLDALLGLQLVAGDGRALADL